MASTVQLISPRRSHVPGAPVGFYPVGVAYLLDALGVSAGAAFSVRLLSSAYLGNCCNIRRSSDNATQDIGFVGGDFDAATFSAFVGAGSGFITKWYDQSGNGRDASQATAASQPQLALNIIGGKPALQPAGAQLLSTASFASSTSPQSWVAVAERTGNFTTEQIIFGASNSNQIGYSTATNTVFVAGNGIVPGTASDSAAHSIIGINNGASSKTIVDGTTVTTGTDSGDVVGSTVVVICKDGSLHPMTGNVSECFMVPSAILSAAQIATIHSSQSAYYGTP